MPAWKKPRLRKADNNTPAEGTGSAAMGGVGQFPSPLHLISLNWALQLFLTSPATATSF